MKKRFLTNDDAASLWNEFEESEAIQIVGGTSSMAESGEENSIETDITKDCTVTIWTKSF